MSKTVNIGGDRIGSGQKMNQTMHGYERSNHDLGYTWKSSMSAGTLVPFLKKVMLPGDTFDINLYVDVMTQPTIGPLFGSYKIQLDLFVAPVRLYIAPLHNNTLGVGNDMSAVKLPLIELTALAWDSNSNDRNNSQINPSCVLAYLGLMGIGYVTTPDQMERRFNAVPLLMLWDVYKNYYANKQEEIGAVIHTPSVDLVSTISSIDVVNTSPDGAGVDTLAQAPTTGPSLLTYSGTFLNIYFAVTQPLLNQIMINTLQHGWVNATQLFQNPTLGGGGLLQAYLIDGKQNINLLQWRYITQSDIIPTPPTVVTFPLSNIDDMRRAILAAPWNTAFLLNSVDLAPYSYLDDYMFNLPSIRNSQEGLPVKTYQSDIYNNWIKTDWIVGPGSISERTAIDTTAGFFTLDQLLLGRKLFDILNRVAISGGSYHDWVEAVYDIKKDRIAESPMYVGGLSQELVFQEVVSNSATENQPLGSLAGKGRVAQNRKGGHAIVRVQEPSYLLGLVSLTPRIDYSQGNDWDMHLLTMDDFKKPGMDQIGFQDLVCEQMAWWSTWYNAGTSTWEQKAAGKQPAWLNYMTDVNRSYGNFAIANNEMFMTLNRRYEFEDGSEGEIQDLTTYIDPSKFNFIFAETQLDAQNFWVQIGIDISARRKMSAKQIPNL